MPSECLTRGIYFSVPLKPFAFWYSKHLKVGFSHSKNVYLYCLVDSSKTCFHPKSNVISVFSQIASTLYNLYVVNRLLNPRIRKLSQKSSKNHCCDTKCCSIRFRLSYYCLFSYATNQQPSSSSSSSCYKSKILAKSYWNLNKQIESLKSRKCTANGKLVWKAKIGEQMCVQKKITISGAKRCKKIKTTSEEVWRRVVLCTLIEKKKKKKNVDIQLRNMSK